MTRHARAQLKRVMDKALTDSVLTENKREAARRDIAALRSTLPAGPARDTWFRRMRTAIARCEPVR